MHILLLGIVIHLVPAGHDRLEVAQVAHALHEVVDQRVLIVVVVSYESFV